MGLVFALLLPSHFFLYGAKIPDRESIPPRDLEVCFSPQESCDEKLTRFIQSATLSLDVAIFDLTHPKIAHEILVKSKKIPVRVVVDKRQARGEHSLVSTLIKAGVPLKFGFQRGIMHNKFVILDRKIIETGSFNFSVGASEKNNENQLYLENPVIVERYRKQFEKLWAEGRPVTPEFIARSEKGITSEY